MLYYKYHTSQTWPSQHGLLYYKGVLRPALGPRGLEQQGGLLPLHRGVVIRRTVNRRGLGTKEPPRPRFAPDAALRGFWIASPSVCPSHRMCNTFARAPAEPSFGGQNRAIYFLDCFHHDLHVCVCVCECVFVAVNARMPAWEYMCVGG